MDNTVSVLLMTSKSGGGFNLSPPMGLYRLKNYLEKHNVKCEILDFDIDSEQEYLKKITGACYDVVGMSVSHINMLEDLNMLLNFHRAAEKSAKKPVFIAGGQEATLNYKQWLSSGLIDIIFLGFAEDALLAFCLALASQGKQVSVADVAGSLDGVVFPGSGGTYVYNAIPPLTSEGFRQMSFINILDAVIPYTKYWKKVNEERIDGVNHTEFILETVRLYTTSHCPRRCGFCSSQAFLPASHNVTTPILMLSAEDVFELVLMHVDRYGARGFLFSDDDFLVGNKPGIERTHKFCRLIIDAKGSGRIPQGIKFFCQSRVADYIEGGKVRLDLLDIMKEAGFDNTGLGIESFSQRLLNSPSINKVGVTVDDYKMVLDALLDKKIIPIIFIIIGVPESTVDELVETMYVAVDYIRKGADVSVTPRLRANPGSPLCNSQGYELSFKYWQSPQNENVLEIQDYFVPENKIIAGIIDKVHIFAEREIDLIKEKKMCNRTIVPKLLIGMATFIATAKLINRQDVADDFSETLAVMLEGMVLE